MRTRLLPITGAILAVLFVVLAYLSLPRYEGGFIDTMSDYPERKLIPPGMLFAIVFIVLAFLSIWITFKVINRSRQG